ncbi:NAD-P-binding protein [Lenzites betulinus]|nr:NAD-P-binding protein [Lenzites betulinus]
MFSLVVSAYQAALSQFIGSAVPPESTNVFIIGATGYVGGAILTRLLDGELERPFDINVLTRSVEKAQQFEPFGVKAVVGSLDSLDILEAVAAQSDVVIECANADHLESTKALLAGLRKRHAITGKVPILIHTSGTAVLSDDAAGMHSTDTIYDDTNLEQMDTIPPTQPHRNVDLTVADADKEGTARLPPRYVKTFIVLPSTIYGLASGPLVDAGIANPRSQQIPTLIRASVDRGQAGMVGAGVNLHPNVHIDDISQLYITILKRALAGDDIGHGREGFYFGENGEHSLYDVAQAMGVALHDMGLARTPAPSSFTKAELDKYFGGSESLGTNVRCRAERGRGIGWKPARTTEDMLASIKPEIEDVIRSRGTQMSPAGANRTS